jgi:dTDP-D-glucose 4,6-dehydratase
VEWHVRLLVTGGAGFIGSAVIRQAIQDNHDVMNLDALTYAACLSNLELISDNPKYSFSQGDICDAEFVKKTLAEFEPDVVMHLAAESHVDRSMTLS